MKKLFTLFAIGLIATLTSNLSAQSQRFVLSEEFTQASCGPCAAQNPAFNALLQENGDKIISIKYQTSWPGVDPMNADNPAEVQNRVDLYGVNGVPMATVDGTLIPFCSGSYEGSPSCLSQTDIDAAYENPSSFDITVDAAVSNGILNVTTDLNCTQDASGNLKLYVVLIEKVIDWGTAPGSNGEVVFYNVMKKFLPNTTGIDISDTWTNGESNSYAETLDLNEINVYDMDQLAVVAFIQDMSTKEILQAGAQLSNYSNSASAVYFSGFPQAICPSQQTLTPSLRIQNEGNNELTSAIITYSINGGEDQNINWSGSVNTLGRVNIELGTYTFSEDENVIIATVSMPNDVEDEDLSTIKTQTATIGIAPTALLELTMILNTDCWPNENTWEIRNSEDSVVALGGPYDGQVETEITETITLPAADCYSFTFMDEFGDGLHGSQWPNCNTDGNLNVFDELGNVVFSYDGSYDISSETRSFDGTSTSSINEVSNFDGLSIYPNPTTTVAHISMNLLESNTVRLEVVDLLGKVVYAEDMGQVAAGNQLFDVDASGITNGMYMFNIYVGEQKVTKRVSISK
jgi:thiol-disulfide isomerase/thioredoxin